MGNGKKTRKERKFLLRKLSPANFLDMVTLHYRYKWVVSDLVKDCLIDHLGSLAGSESSRILEVVDEEGSPFGYLRADAIVPGLGAFVHIIFKPGVKINTNAAAKQGLEMLIKEANLHRVSALIPEKNGFARRLAENLGFKEEGKIREIDKMEGEWEDFIIYGLLRREFLKEEKENGSSISPSTNRTGCHRNGIRNLQCGESKERATDISTESGKGIPAAVDGSGEKGRKTEGGEGDILSGECSTPPPGGPVKVRHVEGFDEILHRVPGVRS